jgi:molybdopterin converting factor small subunit
MKLYVKLYANLAQNLPQAVLARHPQARQRGATIETNLPEDSSLADLVADLELPCDQVKVIFVNGRAQDLDYRPAPGDQLGIFPPIGGGQAENPSEKSGAHPSTSSGRALTVDVWLYGPLARYAGAAARPSYANLHVKLAAGSLMRDLLSYLGLPTEERGITFINGDLSAMPGLQPDMDHPLADGDRVAFFHLKSMWPAQYRDGAALAPGLARAIAERKGPFHHRPRS